MPVEAAYHLNGVTASLDYGIFNVFVRVSVSAIAWAAIGEARRGSARVMIRGACTDCRAYRVTTRQACGASTHAACHMRRCLAGCHSHWLPLINSQGLSAGRSGADSWMRRLGHAPVYRACVVLGRGWAGLGACGALAVFASRTSRLHVHMPTV